MMGTYKIENLLGMCPVCDEEMEPLDIEERGREVDEGYSCENCGLIVTYIWTLPTPSRRELYDDPEVTQKQLDQAEQLERYARDKGRMILERG